MGTFHENTISTKYICPKIQPLHFCKSFHIEIVIHAYIHAKRLSHKVDGMQFWPISKLDVVPDWKRIVLICKQCRYRSRFISWHYGSNRFSPEEICATKMLRSIWNLSHIVPNQSNSFKCHPIQNLSLFFNFIYSIFFWIASFAPNLIIFLFHFYTHY